MLHVDPRTTALVITDLHKGALSMPFAPYPAGDILDRACALARRFRAAGAPVFIANMDWGAEFGDRTWPSVDRPIHPPADGFPSGWSDPAEGLTEPGDILVTKHQWDAFHGTDLDVHLRRRGVRTIVLAGVATNFGVEGAARAGRDHGYEVVVVEDASTSITAEMHRFSIDVILPMLARVVTAAEIDLEHDHRRMAHA
jgi:nicotinamidase-related amidase